MASASGKSWVLTTLRKAAANKSQTIGKLPEKVASLPHKSFACTSSKSKSKEIEYKGEERRS